MPTPGASPGDQLKRTSKRLRPLGAATRVRVLLIRRMDHSWRLKLQRMRQSISDMGTPPGSMGSAERAICLHELLALLSAALRMEGAMLGSQQCWLASGRETRQLVEELLDRIKSLQGQAEEVDVPSDAARLGH